MLYKRATLIQDIRECIKSLTPILNTVLDRNSAMGVSDFDTVLKWVIEHYIELNHIRQIKGHFYRWRALEQVYFQLESEYFSHYKKDMASELGYYIKVPHLYQYHTMEIQLEIKHNQDLYLYFLRDEVNNPYIHLPHY